ncbi:MAG: hypothetical protein J6336_11015, partial [Kiritimatiellae bacterium]|nr:hypothetical protein [Kiritimatiellia bacterium]
TAVGPNGVAANGGAGGGAAGGAGKADPFAELRKKSQVPGVTTGVNGQKMITPEIAFLGFIERPDGSRAALFSDSTDKSTFFYEPGKQVHGVDILSANVREASIRFPDGTTKNVAIGNKLTLAAEPLKTPTAAPKTADAKAAAPNAKGNKADPKGAKADPKAAAKAKAIAAAKKKMAQQKKK